MNYRELLVWQKAMDFVVMCYRVTHEFPKSEVYGLASQLQRAAVSVPANIAEGQGRQHTTEFIQHLSIAYGSLMEAETHLQLSERIGYVDNQSIQPAMEKAGEVGRMLNGLMRALRSKQPDH
jgi:four helix bundle protein